MSISYLGLVTDDNFGLLLHKRRHLLVLAGVNAVKAGERHGLRVKDKVRKVLVDAKLLLQLLLLG